MEDPDKKYIEDILFDMCQYEKVKVIRIGYEATFNITLIQILDQKEAENQFFQNHDIDGNGEVTEKEMIDTFQEMYFHKLEELLYQNENGYEEYMEKRKKLTQTAINVFKLYDRNSDGTILRPELLNIKTELR